MGGNAIIIDGNIDLERATRPGLLGRLFGVKRVADSAISDRGLVDLPAKGFRFLGENFREYVHATFPSPWPSTKCIMDYLGMGIRVYVRGERRGGADLAWYAQVTFSGCAGQAQTSSDLATHWATRWYQDKSESLRRDLVHRGFTPRGLRADVADPIAFLPIGGLGYAEYSAGVDSFSESDGEQTHFAIDESARETFLDTAAADEFLVALESQFGDLMADGHCRCQLCSPDFDIGRLDGLTGL
jgi:hypothetical protein